MMIIGELVLIQHANGKHSLYAKLVHEPSGQAQWTEVREIPSHTADAQQIIEQARQYSNDRNLIG